ncbi:MAG: dTDP-4-dehydrorhamnose reductase [Bacteroidetes bacterium]|nr:MAG: dTDP-4-dehydrorhamnose reductase [Bacteroidota bacterium]
MPKLLITGAGGQLGQALRVLAQAYPTWDFYFPTRAELNITDEVAVAACFQRFLPDYCLNTAAYTAVDRAEEEPERAFASNTEAAKYLAEQCATHGTHLFHYSTDYVYQGDINRPLREDDPTAPAGVYAASKLAGEEAVRGALPAATILRTSWVYSKFSHNFVNTMLRLGRERSELRVVFDQVGTPTSAHDLAAATLYLISQVEQGQLQRHELGGIYHYSNEGVCSWYDFALAIFEIAGIDCSVLPIESYEYPTAARRPHYSVLNKRKIKAAFGLKIPHWRASLAQLLGQ